MPQAAELWVPLVWLEAFSRSMTSRESGYALDEPGIRLGVAHAPVAKGPWNWGGEPGRSWETEHHQVRLREGRAGSPPRTFIRLLGLPRNPPR